MSVPSPQDLWTDIQDRLVKACSRAQRNPKTLTLIGASKRQSEDRLLAAYASGLRDYGENRVLEAESHQQLLPEDIHWHLIGPLQSNKVKKAAKLFSTVHSLSRPKVLRSLNHHAGALRKEIDVFLQVNVGGESQKHGCEPEDVGDLVCQFPQWSNLRLVGLMTLPPFSLDPEEVRPFFRKLARLRDELVRQLGPSFAGWLSMGMSHDFEIAIEEGATHIRLGSALFGPRD